MTNTTARFEPGGSANGHVLTGQGWLPTEPVPLPDAPMSRKPIYKGWTSKILLALTALAAMVAPFAVGATAAQAATSAVTDARGDVGHPLDIQSVTVRNGNTLSITIHHRSLAAGERISGWSGAYIDVDSRVAGPDYYIAGGLGTDYELYWTNGWKRGGLIGGCYYHEGLNYAHNSTVFTLGRRCLNGASFRATKVRVSAVAGAPRRTSDWAPGWHRFSPWVALN